MAQRRQMKAALSTTCKKYQERIGELERGGTDVGENADTLKTFLPKTLRSVFAPAIYVTSDCSDSCFFVLAIITVRLGK